jgi:hypothetical protein
MYIKIVLRQMDYNVKIRFLWLLGNVQNIQQFPLPIGSQIRKHVFELLVANDFT